MIEASPVETTTMSLEAIEVNDDDRIA